MIFATRWIEWVVRVIAYAALTAVIFFANGIDSWSDFTPVPVQAIVTAAAILLLMGIIEYRVRRLRCWAVTSEFDFDQLRAFFRADPANRHLPLHSQRTAYEANPPKPSSSSDNWPSKEPKPAAKAEEPPPTLPALEKAPVKAEAKAPQPAPKPIAVATPVPAASPAPAKTPTAAPATTPSPKPAVAPVPTTTPPAPAAKPAAAPAPASKPAPAAAAQFAKPVAPAPASATQAPKPAPSAPAPAAVAKAAPPPPSGLA